MTSITENLERVRLQIAQTAAKSGVQFDEIELVAISKTHDAVKVREAIEAEQRLFGEKSGAGGASKDSGIAVKLAMAFRWTPPEK